MAARELEGRDGAPALLKSIRRSFPWQRHIFADGAYARQKLRGALGKIRAWKREIVKRADTGACSIKTAREAADWHTAALPEIRQSPPHQPGVGPPATVDDVCNVIVNRIIVFR